MIPNTQFYPKVKFRKFRGIGSPHILQATIFMNIPVLTGRFIRII